MFLLSQVTTMVFWSIWSSLVYLVQFSLFRSISILLVHYSLFGPFYLLWLNSQFIPFLSTLFNSIHLVHFGDALWGEICVEDELLHWKSCHLLNIILVGSWFDPFGPLRRCIVRRSLCRKRSCFIDNYVMLSI